MAVTSSQQGSTLAIDVGTVRIGLALASNIARLPSPLTTLHNGNTLWDSLQDICRRESVTHLVIGLPRGLDGQETAQTEYCRQFALDATTRLSLEVTLQDEALTSQKAEAELAAKGRQHTREDIDALAATYILEDYLNSQGTHA